LTLADSFPTFARSLFREINPVISGAAASLDPLN
jgi:hypothetical protein